MRDASVLPAALQRPALTPIPRLLLSREDARARSICRSGSWMT